MVERNVQFSAVKEYIKTFRVPEYTRRVRVEVTAVVDLVSRKGDPIHLSSSDEITINNSDSTDNIDGLHLRHNGNEFQLIVLGKGG